MAPEIGTTKLAQDVGLSQSRRKVTWAACVDCGTERWVWLDNGKPQSYRCFPCGRKQGGRTFSGRYYGPRASAWEGGRTTTKEGYIRVVMAPDDPFIGMSSRGRFYTGPGLRLVMGDTSR